jgi:hypothetical protein
MPGTETLGSVAAAGAAATRMAAPEAATAKAVLATIFFSLIVVSPRAVGC